VALVLAALLGGCATAGPSSVAEGAATPDGLMHMADKARERGELPVAASLYRKAHDEEPQRVKPLVSLGQVLMEMQLPDQAAEAFSAGLVIDSHNLEALRGLGNARLALHQPEQAIPPLKQALSISANDFRVLNALGVAYDMSEDHPGALQYYRTGLKLAPDNTALRSNYALSLALAGKTDDALETIAPLANAEVTTSQQRQTMALVYGLAGNTAEAERLSRIDLDEAAVKANMERIAALRNQSPSTSEVPAPTTPEPQPAAAVSREPLQPSDVKVEPVSFKPISNAEPAPAATQVSSVPTQTASADPVALAAASDSAPAGSTQPSAPAPAAKPEQQAALSQASMGHGPAAESGKSTAKEAAAPVHTSGDAWLVQLASYLDEKQAQKGWGKLSATAPDLLSAHQPIVQEARLSDDSVVWRLRMGPYSAYSEAAGMCEQLKAHGVDCYVTSPGS
jgi:Flp pilus assembly protein TadD